MSMKRKRKEGEERKEERESLCTFNEKIKAFHDQDRNVKMRMVVVIIK